MLILPVSALLVCQCQNAYDKHPYCISYGGISRCLPEDRIPPPEAKFIITKDPIPDGSKEFPIHWDVDNPPSDGKGWYYYVSPNRPFFLPYNTPTIIG
jgi:hypothetical protein